MSCKAHKAVRPSFLSLAIASIVAVAALTAAAPASAAPGTRHPLAIRGEHATPLASPTATAVFGCETRAFAGLNLFCYGPAAIRAAYGTDQLIAQGITGRGRTIVIIDAFGSPTIAADLQLFDKTFGLPDPDFKQIQMPGVPAFDPTNANQVGWAEEVALDVQWSHVVAPGAKIVLIAAASNSDDDLRAALNYAIQHYPGAIVSESFGESEYDLVNDPTGVGQQIIAADEASYAAARAAKITVFASSGDSGSADGNTDPTTGLPLIPYQDVLYPSTSPNVTAAGGTNLWFGAAGSANPNGKYITETVWNDGFGAGGGGVSFAFAAPSYPPSTLPASTQTVLAGARGVPDVAYNAGVLGGVLVNLGFLGPNSGFYLFGGTSAAAPQWAGIAALASQLKGAPLGFINPKLYRLGAEAVATIGLPHDVTAGQNGFNTIQGYPAGPGWDLSTGWGTPTALVIRALAGDD